MKKPIISNINRLIKRANDTIGEEGFISLFSKDYASLSEEDRKYILDVILNDYQITVTELIYACLDEYSNLHKIVDYEYKKTRRIHLSDPKDDLAKARYRTWVKAKERQAIQKRLIIQCVIDNSAHISYDLENELKVL